MHSQPTEPCIYIVDDDPALAQMACQILGLRGYEAAVFDDPAKALAHLKERPTSAALLITDGVMGPMNGMELIEAFRKQVANLRTILMSGTITDDFVRKSSTKPDRFIAKPYPADTLLDTVDELLGRGKTKTSPKG